METYSKVVISGLISARTIVQPVAVYCRTTVDRTTGMGYGPDGLSAFEVAVENGYTGTEEQWLLTLKGDKGDKGDTGIDFNITASPTEPQNPAVGDLWIDTSI